MTKNPHVKPLSAPNKDGPFGHYVLRGKDGEGPDLKYEVRHHEPGQEALFVIEGPDEDGCVWICSPEGRDVWCQNLGPSAKAAEVMSQWLGSINFLENE